MIFIRHSIHDRNKWEKAPFLESINNYGIIMENIKISSDLFYKKTVTSNSCHLALWPKNVHVSSSLRVMNQKIGGTQNISL